MNTLLTNRIKKGQKGSVYALHLLTINNAVILNNSGLTFFRYLKSTCSNSPLSLGYLAKGN